jgi:lysophospholipase L1-like esterase
MCAGTLAGFLIAEGLVRAFHLVAIPAPRRVVYAGESREWCCGPEVMVENVHRFEPNTTFEHCYSGRRRDYFDEQGCVTYHINRWGYRTGDFALEKPDDVYRIIFLGDSFTFGEGTPESLVFTALVSTALQERHVDGRRIEVINLGIPAEDGDSELASYREFDRTLAPDWVILQWNTNDVPLSGVQQDHLRLIGRQYRELFDGNPYRWSRLLSMVYFLERSWRISHEIMDITKQQAETGRGSFDAIGELRWAARADGADFTVLAFPEIIRFDDYPYAAIIDLLKQYCQSQQIALVDLLPALSAHRDRELWVHETDHHPNRIAHAIAARELLNVIGPRLDRDDAAKRTSK